MSRLSRSRLSGGGGVSLIGGALDLRKSRFVAPVGGPARLDWGPEITSGGDLFLWEDANSVTVDISPLSFVSETAAPYETITLEAF